MLKTGKNEQIIEDFITQVLVKPQFEKSVQFLSKDIISNDFEITLERFKFYWVIGEKNFVLTQSEVTISEIPYVMYICIEKRSLLGQI